MWRVSRSVTRKTNPEQGRLNAQARESVVLGDLGEGFVAADVGALCVVHAGDALLRSEELSAEGPGGALLGGAGVGDQAGAADPVSGGRASQCSRERFESPWLGGLYRLVLALARRVACLAGVMVACPLGGSPAWQAPRRHVNRGVPTLRDPRGDRERRLGGSEKLAESAIMQRRAPPLEHIVAASRRVWRARHSGDMRSVLPPEDPAIRVVDARRGRTS